MDNRHHAAGLGDGLLARRDGELGNALQPLIVQGSYVFGVVSGGTEVSAVISSSVERDQYSFQ